jgi:Skp family chaperone for outer membrane proteins|tara:strand:- start:48 stop:209 length:162 start_codon:yes stop_codon:yes gene_type:complete
VEIEDNNEKIERVTIELQSLFKEFENLYKQSREELKELSGKLDDVLTDNEIKE